jgi:hypothetical protein
VQRPPFNPADLVGQARTRVQRQFAEFERGAADRLGQLLSPSDGALWQRVDQALHRLQSLERAGEIKQAAVRIPRALESEILSDVRETITVHLASDLQAQRDLLGIVMEELNQLLADAGVPDVSWSVRYLTGDAIQRLADARVRIDRPFRGELPPRGAGEYLAVFRRNYSLIPLSLALLGTLLPHFQLGWGLRVIVIVLGAFLLHRIVVQSRHELTERELEKARESIRAEVRRIANDVERAWPGVVNEYLKEQFAQLISQAEASARDSATRRNDELNEEKRRVQRQLQGLEGSERQLAGTAKRRDVFTSSASQFYGELRQLFQGVRQQLRGARA